MSTAIEKPTNWIRLACARCDRDDYDGISEHHLELIRPLWGDVEEVQSWADSMTVWDDLQCKFGGRSNLDWWTHLGACPDCLNLVLDLSQGIILDLKTQQPLFD